MKQLKPILLLLTLCVLILVSCKKSNPKPTASITFMFNGTTKSSPDPVGIYSKSTGIMAITAQFGGTSAIYLDIYNVKVGTFYITISSSQPTAAYLPDVNATDSYNATSGSIVVTSYTDSTISGTFQFFATNTVIGYTGNFTQGSFTVNYATTQ